MAQHARKLQLEGALNIRDLGGYPAGEAGTTCWKRYLRGDSPHLVTPHDIRALLDYGVRTIIDLREPGEVVQWPSRMVGVAGVAVHHVPLLAELTPALAGAMPPTDLGELYLLFLRHGGGALKRVFEILGAGNGGVVLFHCAIGKDRTGVAAALLLSLLGASRRAILEDYTASEDNLRPLVAELARQYAQDPATGTHPDLLRCLPMNMERMLDFLESEYGGAAAYLRRAGVAENVLQAIQGAAICRPSGTRAGMDRFAAENTLS